MANLNDGEVVITLGDDAYTLRPTLNAIRTLSRLHGGLRNTFQKVINQDFDGIAEIIKVGASIPDKDNNALSSKLFRAGLNDTTLMPVLDYIRCLMNGGKMPPEIPDEPPAEASEGNA
jgi:hypothetical protein